MVTKNRLFYGLFAFILWQTPNVKAQNFVTTNGVISFFSKTIMKNIFAETKTANAILSTKTNDIAIRINNQQFKFENSLMEEHFNEKYMESNKYPISTFAGKINEKIDFKQIGEKDFSVTGKFKIHGAEQTKTLTGKINIEKDKIVIQGGFKIKLDEFKITKPSVVTKEIADEMDIKVNLELIKK